LRDKLAQLESAPAPQVQDKAQEAQKQVELGNMSMQEYTDYMKTLFSEEARRIAHDEITQVTNQQQEDQLANKAVSDFSQADPRLNLNSPDSDEKFAVEVQRELADLLDEHLEKTGGYKGFDTSELTKNIVARRDAELDDIIKKRTQDSTQAAKMREAKYKKGEVRGSTVSSQSVGGNSIRNILSDTLDNMS